jgi:hypothetical protein
LFAANTVLPITLREVEEFPCTKELRELAVEITPQAYEYVPDAVFNAPPTTVELVPDATLL